MGKIFKSRTYIAMAVLLVGAVFISYHFALPSLRALSESQGARNFEDAQAGEVYLLTAIVWPSGLCEVRNYQASGVARAVSNLDFRNIPQSLKIEKRGEYSYEFLNIVHTAANASYPADWPASLPATVGRKEFVTDWDGSVSNRDVEAFYDALEVLHAFVEENGSELARRATRERESLREATIQNQKERAERARRFQESGRLPVVVGVEFKTTRGGKAVSMEEVVRNGGITSGNRILE